MCLRRIGIRWLKEISKVLRQRAGQETAGKRILKKEGGGGGGRIWHDFGKATNHQQFAPGADLELTREREKRVVYEQMEARRSCRSSIKFQFMPRKAHTSSAPALSNQMCHRNSTYVGLAEYKSFRNSERGTLITVFSSLLFLSGYPYCDVQVCLYLERSSSLWAPMLCQAVDQLWCLRYLPV